jgi:flagellar hook protein FlgE
MEALNNNVWIATTESGTPLLTHAKSGGSGEIAASSLESSTVDLATEFSNMIIVQRAYSAAGKIITTSDEMLQELTSLI